MPPNTKIFFFVSIMMDFFTRGRKKRKSRVLHDERPIPVEVGGIFLQQSKNNNYVVPKL